MRGGTGMLQRGLFFVTIAVALLWGTFAFAGVNMQEGLWEISSQVEISGMPMQMPVRKHTQCITKKNIVPEEPKKEQECKLTDRRISGNTVTWVVKCSGKEPMEMTGKITYYGDSFNGVIKMTSSDSRRGKVKMTNHLRGRRIGACKK